MNKVYTKDIITGVMFQCADMDTVYTIEYVDDTRCNITWILDDNRKEKVTYATPYIYQALNSGTWIETEESLIRDKIQQFLEDEL
jgi:hypothetical protein